MTLLLKDAINPNLVRRSKGDRPSPLRAVRTSPRLQARWWRPSSPSPCATWSHRGGIRRPTWGPKSSSTFKCGHGRPQSRGGDRGGHGAGAQDARRREEGCAGEGRRRRREAGRDERAAPHPQREEVRRAGVVPSIDSSRIPRPSSTRCGAECAAAGVGVELCESVERVERAGWPWPKRCSSC